MAQLMDQSLDDIIRQNNSQRGFRGGRGGRGGRGRGGRRGGGGGGGGESYSYGPIRRRSGGGGGGYGNSPAPYQSRAMERDTWDHDMYDQDNLDSNRPVHSRLGSDSRDGTKVVLRNLQDTVTQEDIQELFSVVGPLKSVEVEYDRSGRSLGSAVAFFVKRRDAESAVAKYNGMSLDNQPMEIFIVEPRKSFRSHLSSGSGIRIGTSADGHRRVVVDQHHSNGYPRRRSHPNSGYEGRGRRGGRGGGRGRGGRQSKTTPTKEELDTQLANFASQQLQSMSIDS